MVSAALQVLAAVVIVIIMMAIAMWQFYRDKFNAIRNATGTIKRTVVIFDGIKDFNGSADMYDLYNANQITYKNLANSVNQDSGMVYSYNFWLYIDQNALSGQNTSILGKINTPTSGVSADAGLDRSKLTASDGSRSLLPLVLFQRGDPRVFTYISACTGKPKTDAVIKNPIVKLENGGDVLSVEFNAIDHPDAHQMCPSAQLTSKWPIANQQKVGIQGLTTTDALIQKWFMVTIVVQQTDTTTTLSNRNNSVCTIYVNGTQQVGPVKVQGGNSMYSSIRSASGNLYVNKPLYKQSDDNNHTYSITLSANGTLNDTGGDNSKDGRLMMANLTYFNYALGPGDVAGLFQVGFTHSAAPSSSQMAMSLAAGVTNAGTDPAKTPVQVSALGGGT
jgi:endonuclease YncB( thermonuclease family)